VPIVDGMSVSAWRIILLAVLGLALLVALLQATAATAREGAGPVSAHAGPR
jgi:hypothetical protein